MSDARPPRRAFHRLVRKIGISLWRYQGKPRRSNVKDIGLQKRYAFWLEKSQLLCLLVMWIFPLPLFAQSQAPLIGRLTLPNGGYCSSVVIAPRLVLSAAHCFYTSFGVQIPSHQASWTLIPNKTYQDAFGAKLERVFVHPNYQFSAQDQAARRRYDLALILLDKPLLNLPKTNIGAPRFSLDPRKDTKMSALFLADPHQAISAPCALLGRDRGAFLLDCSIDPGASGGALYQMGGNGFVLTGILSARADLRGQIVSFGVDVSRQFQPLIRELQRAIGIHVMKLPEFIR